MVILTIERLVQQAVIDGWASGDGSLDDIERQASYLNWDLVSSRSDGPVSDVLKPTKPGDAPKQSLSAKYGLGSQPLHTDGAHHAQPPDIVLLAAASTSDVPTLLWRFGPSRVPKEVLDGLRHGLFTVRSGKDAFLASAWDGQRLRFDPGCMEPSDQRARRVLAFFETARENAKPFNWTEPGKILAIDNRRILHARAAAEHDPFRTMHRAAIRLPKGTK